MITAKVDILGLEEAQEFFSTSKQKKAIAKSLGVAILGLHGALRASVNSRYSKNNDIEKQRINKGSALRVNGGLYSQGLEYRIKFNDLSKFPTTWYWGNINSPARNKGRVHKTTIVRGREKIIHGKSGRGGFVPRNKSGKAIHLFNGGSQMLERTSNKHLPLRVLYGPNTANMINYALSKDKIVDKVLTKLELDIIDNYI